jgi:hypothetical protein
VTLALLAFVLLNQLQVITDKDPGEQKHPQGDQEPKVVPFNRFPHDRAIPLILRALQADRPFARITPGLKAC